MPKRSKTTGRKNLIGRNLAALRKRYHLSQQGLAHELQLVGHDMDKNVITRIETGQRYVSDFELLALCEFFGVTFDEITAPAGETQEETEK